MWEEGLSIYDVRGGGAGVTKSGTSPTCPLAAKVTSEHFTMGAVQYES